MESQGPNYTFVTDGLSSFCLDSFQPKRCTKIWHDKQRENETIPIWNLIVALAENSESQWSQWNALGRKIGKAFHVAWIFPKTQLTYLSQSVVKFHCVISNYS